MYFPVQPICKLITEDSRNELMEKVKRDTVNDKILGLVNEYP